MGKNAEHPAIPLLESEIETRQYHLSSGRERLRGTFADIREALTVIERDSENQEPYARLRTAMMMTETGLNEMQRLAREIGDLRHAVETLRRATV